MFEGFAVGSRISWLRNTTFWEMFFMGLVFALITPIGMAIGLGVIRRVCLFLFYPLLPFSFFSKLLLQFPSSYLLNFNKTVF